MPTYGNQLGAPYTKLEAVNTGHRVVTVKTLTFERPGGARLAPMLADRFPGMRDTRLPGSLLHGQSAHLLLPFTPGVRVHFDHCRFVSEQTHRSDTILSNIGERRTFSNRPTRRPSIEK